MSIDPRLIAALIGAGVASAGWVFKAWLDKAQDQSRRQERVRDVQTALVAEILPYLEALQLFDLTDHLEQVVDKMRRQPEYFPLVPTERNDTVFRAVLSEIHVLPEPVIKPVVRYYSQLFAIEALIEDLRGQGVRNLDGDAREAMYTDYISMKVQALKLGQNAVAAIEAQLGRRL
ncbi:hypothetical protein [Neptunicoccus sediminis]|uniref:hypothetical protein n=1 Tax=Neptunicoccus sediminis TaxID=1892596 RepID=UPI0012FF9C3A|nr:hypothetical protein [Neptunicoccus sediminis]